MPSARLEEDPRDARAILVVLAGITLLMATVSIILFKRME
jgi:hypothetical protein